MITAEIVFLDFLLLKLNIVHSDPPKKPGTNLCQLAFKFPDRLLYLNSVDFASSFSPDGFPHFSVSKEIPAKAPGISTGSDNRDPIDTLSPAC